MDTHLKVIKCHELNVNIVSMLQYAKWWIPYNRYIYKSSLYCIDCGLLIALMTQGSCPVAIRDRLNARRTSLWLVSWLQRDESGSVVQFAHPETLSVYRRRPSSTCGSHEVHRDLPRLTATERSHGALAFVPVLASEAHGLFTQGEHLLEGVTRLTPAAVHLTLVQMECRFPGQKTHSISLQQLLWRQRRDGWPVVCLQ